MIKILVLVCGLTITLQAKDIIISGRDVFNPPGEEAVMPSELDDSSSQTKQPKKKNKGYHRPPPPKMEEEVDQPSLFVPKASKDIFNNPED